MRRGRNSEVSVMLLKKWAEDVKRRREISRQKSSKRKKIQRKRLLKKREKKSAHIQWIVDTD